VLAVTYILYMLYTAHTHNIHGHVYLEVRGREVSNDRGRIRVWGKVRQAQNRKVEKRKAGLMESKGVV
jgi:hypothetical protein